MFKMIMMPPQSAQTRQWAERLREALPDYQIVAPETDADARRDIADADAAYGWVPPRWPPGCAGCKARPPARRAATTTPSWLRTCWWCATRAACSTTISASMC